MEHSPDTIRAALLLTNRLVQLDAKPLSAREFWAMCSQVDVGDLLNLDAAEIGSTVGLSGEEAVRVRTLLDAATALSFEQDRLQEGGVAHVSAFDDTFPSGLRERLGSACPPFLLVAGPVSWLNQPGLGVVGSRDAGDELLSVASDAGRLAVDEGWPVVSGLAKGVDQSAMFGALEAGGAVVGIPADGILKASRNTEVRSRVHAGELCLASPYAPGVPFRAGNALGRNKIIYGLSKLTFVVSAEKGKGGTWSGAKESLDQRFAPVAVWTGEGAREGNHALARQGARSITDLSQLFKLDLDQPPPPEQDSLF